jgi:hypothetical protein
MSGATIRMVTVGLIWVWLVDSVGGVFVCLFCFFFFFGENVGTILG